MKFLLIWELGRGHGHQLQLEKLQSFLVARGHFAVIYSANDTAVDGKNNAKYPTIGLKKLGRFIIRQWIFGFRIHCSKIGKWQLIFQHEKPDAIILDHAPFAHIAAYCMQIPCIEFGSAFTVPSRGNPVGHFDNALPPFNEGELISYINTLLAGKNWRDGIGLEPFLLRLNPAQVEVNAYVPAGVVQTCWPAHWVISNKPRDLNALEFRT